MTILIGDNSPRISYSVAEGVTQTSFTVPFEFFDDADLNVYVDDVLKTLTTDYTVSGGDGSTGTVTISVTGASGGSTVVITRDIALERTTDFPPTGPFQVASLNRELDRMVAITADLQDLADRGLRLSDSDTTSTLVLAPKNTRKGTVLAFNATTGDVEVGPTIADTQSIADVTADIATLADIEDGTTATNAIQTVASISSNVTTVAGVSSDVTTVAGQTTNMQNITDNLTAVQNAATNATNAASSASAAATSATNAATSEANASTSETNAASSATSAASSASTASTAATNASNSATTASTAATNASTSASNASTSETNAANSATAAASSASAASTSASAASTSASSAASAQSAAEAARDSALAAYDNFDDRYLGAKASDPATDNDGNTLVAGALYFNTTTEVMKLYTGSAWTAAYVSGDGFAPLSGATFTGDITVPNLITSGNVDGRDVSADGTKLDGIESGATADQTGAEIASAVSGETVAELTVTDLNTTSINGGQVGGRRNLLYNGAMQIAQRGTSFASTSAPAYTLDRWYWNSQAEDVVTVEKSSDHPKGSGSSIKVTVTTADTSTTDDYADIEQRLEGVDLQHLLYGTADAKSLTLSFWVKSSQTGDMAVGLYIADDGRNIGSTVTISSANTWEYKTVTFAGDTTGVIDNDGGEGMRVWMHLLAGSDFTSVDNTAWGTYAGNRKAYGQTLNVIGTTSATFQLADVQLEVGSVATEFEYRSAGEELALCQRYYQNPASIQCIFSSYVVSGNFYYHSSTFPVEMRATPTMTYTIYATPSGFALTNPAGLGTPFGQYTYKASTSTANTGYYTYRYTADAEL